MKRLKVVQIGTGHDHAFAAIEYLKKRKDIEFLGYVKVEKENKDFDGVNELSYAEVLDMNDIDAVFVETEDKYLTDYAYEFVKRGIPVHMDKPGGQDKQSFDKLFDLAKEKNTPVHLGYMYRYNPAICRLSQYLRDGRLGKILYAEAQMSYLHSEEKRKWLRDYKGGMMNFLGCHLIDVILRLQGVPDEVIPFNTSSGQCVGEDITFAVFKYGDNASFVKSTGVEAGGFMRRQIVVCCEKGTVEIKPTERVLQNGKVKTDMYISFASESDANFGKKPKKISFGPFDRYKKMYDEFFDIVKGKKQNPYSYEYEKTLHDVLLGACNVKTGKER